MAERMGAECHWISFYSDIIYGYIYIYTHILVYYIYIYINIYNIGIGFTCEHLNYCCKKIP